MPDGKVAKPTEKPLSRIKSLGDKPVPFPHVGFGRHLIDYLFKIGMVSSGGMGIDAISFAEIMAWSSGTNTSLDPWEFQTLHDLSGQYASELQKSGDRGAAPPWSEAPDDGLRKKIIPKIRNILRD